MAIISFHDQFPLEGYRPLTFMMLDRNVVAVSPSSTYRVLKAAGLLQRWNPKASCKGNGFQQPLEPHEHWHVNISYLNIAGTFFYLCSVLDGCSRFLLHWELRNTQLNTQFATKLTPNFTASNALLVTMMTRFIKSEYPYDSRPKSRPVFDLDKGPAASAQYNPTTFSESAMVIFDLANKVT